MPQTGNATIVGMATEKISCIVEVGSGKPDEDDDLMSHPEFKPLHLQFCPWLIQQISSGKYLDLEWLDAEDKTLFKIPWTKKFYPYWEEHHEIFRAWAAYRGKHAVETLSLCQMKSNFRTILRKCGVIEEVPMAHQLGLQTGNYKVYKVLSHNEAQEKKQQLKELQKTRVPVKRRKRKNQNGVLEDPKNSNQPGQKAKESQTTGVQRKKMKLPQSSYIDSPKVARLRLDMVIQEKVRKAHEMAVTGGNKGDESYKKDDNESVMSDDAIPPQLGAFVEAVSSDTDGSEARRDSPAPAMYFLPSIPQTVPPKAKQKVPQVKEEVATVTEIHVEKESLAQEHPTPTVFAPGPLHGFQMLLDAAQIAEEHSNQARFDGVKEVNSPIPRQIHMKHAEPSIVDVLLELNIPPDELFTYELHVKYETKHVVDTCLGDMSHGYRIFYGNSSDSAHQNGGFSALDDFACTPIKLPESHVPPGNSLYTVLKNMHPGLILKSDNKTHTLYGKRLCQSRIFTFTSYGEIDAQDEPMNMINGQSAMLFSYRNFLNDWRQFLIEGSPYPNIEVNCSFGKKPKQRHSRVFVSMTVIPKAAKTMMERISSVEEKDDLDAGNSQDSSFDNILKMFYS